MTYEIELWYNIPKIKIKEFNELRQNGIYFKMYKWKIYPQRSGDLTFVIYIRYDDQYQLDTIETLMEEYT